MSRFNDPKERALSHRPHGDFLPALILVAAALLAYIPAMRGGFFWDDYTFLVHNPLIEARDGLRRIWFTAEPPEYLPLTYTTHWLDWRLWGEHPEGPHALNVLLHAASAVLLWRVLLRLRLPGPFDPAQRDRPEGNRMGGAWLAGLLFAVHPVAVASAGWIMERKNVLSMVFYLSSLLAFLKFDEMANGKLGNWEIGKLGNSIAFGIRQSAFGIDESPNLPVSQSPNLLISASPRLRVYILSLCLFLLALLSKTSVVMLPFILLLCAWWRRGKISRKDLLRSLPFFALSLALGLVTIRFQWHGWRPAVGEGFAQPLGAASRAAAAGWIAWFYIFKTLLPVNLCVLYPRWSVAGSNVLAFLPLLLLLGGMAFLWTRRNRSGRAPLFAFACFLITLLPVLGFLDMAFMQLSLVADHLQYAAMIAVIALAAGLLARAASARGWKGRAAVAATAACVAILAFLTWGRASLYRDDGALLWRDNLARNSASPAAWVAWHHLGDICVRARDYEGAVRDFDRVIALNPDYAVAWHNRANARLRLGQYDLALSDCDRAIALKGDFAAAWHVRAGIRYALKEYRQALEDEETCRSLGGRPDPAFLDALTRAAAGAH